MSLHNEPARTYWKSTQLAGKRKEPRRGVSSKFKPDIWEIIIERDNGACVRCRAPYEEIHHVIFRSALGKGTVDNGVCICRSCHALAHKHDKVRRWFERYREENLLNDPLRPR